MAEEPAQHAMFCGLEKIMLMLRAATQSRQDFVQQVHNAIERLHWVVC